MPSYIAAINRHTKSEDRAPRAAYASPQRRPIPYNTWEPTRIRPNQSCDSSAETVVPLAADALLRELLAWRDAAASSIVDLTPREHEIMDLILVGQPSKNIAADLGISQRTVENHRASIMKKTGSKSIPALTRLAFVAVWIDAAERGMDAESSFLQSAPPRHTTAPPAPIGVAAPTARATHGRAVELETTE